MKSDTTPTASTGSANPAPGFAKHPDHVLAITQLMPPRRVIVSLNGETIADTLCALEVSESKYPARYYVPKADVAMGKLSGTEKSTYCPFKGTARYWTVSAGSAEIENGAWAYDDPYDECTDLKDHICFFGEQMDIRIG